MLQKIFALFTLCVFASSPGVAFDTLWHTTISRRVGAEFGFSESAINIMQMGNFSPDFFGPIAQYAAGNLNNKALEAFNKEGLSEDDVKAFAIFLHFDNLGGQLDRNSGFDYLFAQLLQSTQKLLADFGTQKDVDERTRKILTLMTLGASLHAVQDFYSHSDWVHNDFTHLSVKMVALPSGESRAPTWFEVRAKLGDPEKWPFQVRSGLYPPVPNNPLTHTHMNHDNSRLLFREYEISGGPVVPQAQYHDVGPVPANPDDAAAIKAHQQLAVNTAVGASLEWVKKIEENGGAKAAIEAAKTWDLKSDNAKLAKELDAGMAAQMALSCAAGKWDGDEPPPEVAVICRAVISSKVNPIGTGNGSVKDEVLTAAAKLGLPVALRWTGRFWSVYSKYNILGQLAASIGEKAGKYKLPQK